MLTLYQFEISPFCDKARRILHWKKQPYEVHEVSLWQARTQLRRLIERHGLAADRSGEPA